VIESLNGFDETEKRLLVALDAASLKVAARVDHAANAESVGLKLPRTVLLIFGNPKAGTVLMEKNRTVGLAYNDPAYLAQRHGLDGVEPVLTQVGQALQRFSTAATGR